MRSVITDLSPGQVYYIQAQTVSDDGVSEWSPRVELNTAVDTLAPATPNGLTIAMASSSAVLSWNQVLLNADGTLCNDLKTYRVTVKSASSSASYVKDNGLSSTMEFTFEQNRKTFGSPKSDLFFEVVAIDTLNNASQVAVSATTSTTPPPAPTNFSAIGLQDSVVLNWDKVVHPALAAYRVYQGTTSNFAMSTPIFEGSTTAFLHNTSMYDTDHYYKVVAVDMFDKVSTPATVGPVRPASPFRVDTTGPATPTALAATLTNAPDGKSASATLTWTAPVNPDGDTAEYVIGYKPSTASDWEYTSVPKSSTGTRIDGLTPFVNYDFRIMAKDWTANESNWSSVLTKTATANTAPATVTGVTMTAGRDSITATWNANTEVDVANGAGVYLVEISPSATFATGVLTYRTGATSHTVAGVSENTTYYVRVKAIDSGLLQSAAWSTTASAKTGIIPALSDGAAPASSPVATLVSGFGYLFASWTPIANNDLVTYEVHLGTTTGFTPSASTKVAEMTGTTTMIETTGTGAALGYGTTYYAKIIAKDRDGAAAASAASNGAASTKISTSDTTITPGTIGAATPSDVSTAVQDKASIFYQDNEPSSVYRAPTTLWIDTTAGGNTPKRWNGSGWSVVTDKVATDAANAVNTINNTTLPAMNSKIDGAIKSSVNEYAVSASETVAPTSGWSTATPTRTPGTFVWFRTTVTYTNNSTATTNPALLTGNTGQPGAAGAAAAVVSLTATTQVLTQPAAGGATTPNTSVITGTAVNTTITVWEYSVNGAAFSATVPAGVSRSGNTVTVTGSTMTARTITVRMADANGIADTMTVGKVIDGAAGQDGGAGGAGADAYTVMLTNEAQVFAGSTTAAVAGSATSTVVALKGAAAVPATIGTITGQVTGLTTAITNNGTTNATITINVTTALTTQSGTLTIPLTIDGKSFTKTFAWSVSRTGAAGATGVGITSVTPYFNQVTSGAATPAVPTASPAPAPWTTTEPTYADNTELYRTERILYTNGTFAYTGVSKVSAYTAAVLAMTSASGKNKIVYSVSNATGTNYSEGDTWRKVTALGGTGKIVAEWTFTSGAWASKVYSGLNVTDIDAGSITTGFLDVANRIQAGSLVIGQVGGLQSDLDAKNSQIATLKAQALDAAQNAVNMIVNPSFEADFEGWTHEGSAPFMVINTTNTRTGSKRAYAGVGTMGILSSPIKVSPGQTIKLGVFFTAGSIAGVAGGIRLQTSTDGVTWYTSGAANGWVDKSFVNSSTYSEISNEYTVPASVNYLRLRIATALTGGAIGIDDAYAKDLTESKRLETVAADVEARAISRGTDLVTNGNGSLKTNYNFGSFNIALDDAPTGAVASFYANFTNAAATFINELIPFDPAKSYRFGFQARQTVAGATNRMYGMLAPYDAFGNSIQPGHYMYITGTTTTLAKALSPGDTTITLTSAANWYGQSGKAAGGSTHMRSIIFWDYVDSNGKAWPVESYSRNWSGSNYWADGGIVGNVITLSNPYSGPSRAVGTPVSNGTSGGSYMYIPAVQNVVVPETWTSYGDVFSAGIMSPAQQAVSTASSATWTTGMPPGTAQVKVGWLLNYAPNPANAIVGRHAIAAVSFSDASAAQATANATKSLTDSWTYTGTTTINGGMIQTDTIDVIKLKAGSTFTQNLNVASQFTLGTASTDGVIISHGYTDAGTSGFKLSKGGLVIKGAGNTIHGAAIVSNTVDVNSIKTSTLTSTTITLGAGGRIVTNTGGVQITDSGIIIPAGVLDANVIKANTSIVTYLNIGAGGVVQSTGYSPTGTSGFRLGNDGLTIKGAGNNISASALSAGTITGELINVGQGGQLVVDSTGLIRSSNWSSKSTGYRLDTTIGLEVNDGDINAKVLRANTAFATDLIVGSSTSAGSVRSFNYNQANKTGYKLTPTSLEIHDGTISAKALNLQWGQNLYHPAWADFEWDYRYYMGIHTSNVQPLVNFSTVWSGRVSLMLTFGGAGSWAWFGGQNELVARVDPSKKVIVSFYMNQADNFAVQPMLGYEREDGTVGVTYFPARTYGTGWVRVYDTFTFPTTGSPATGRIKVGIRSSTADGLNKTVYIDGVQVEEQMGSSTEPSSWTPPSSTTIDGASIKTGSIMSNVNGANNNSVPAWSIDTQGAARFGNALITDQLIVGEGENYSLIKSMNYNKNKAGWIIDSTGRFEANEGVFRGRLGLGVVQSNLVADSSFESETPITSAFTQNAIDKWTYWGAGSVGGQFQWGWEKTKSAAKSGHSSALGRVLATNSSNLQSPLFAMIPGRTYEVTVSFLRQNNAGNVSLTQKLWVNGNEWKTTDSAFGAVSVKPETDSIKYTVGGTTNIVAPVNNTAVISNPPVAANMANVEGTEFVTLSTTYVVPADKPFGMLEFTFTGLTSGTTNWNYIMLDDVSVIEHGKGGTELTSAGIRLFDVYGQEAGAFVHNRPNYLSVGDNASISQDGKAKFAGVDTPELTFGDVALIGETARAYNDTVNLQLPDEADALPETSLMDRRGRGYMGRMIVPAATYGTTGAVRQKTFLLWPGRAYRFTLSGGPVTNTIASGATQSVGVRAHLAFPSTSWAPTTVEGTKMWVPDNAGAAAANPSTLASTVLLDSRVLAPANVSGVQSCPSISKVIMIAPDGATGTGFTGAKAGYMNVVLGAVTGSSSNSLVLEDQMEMTVEDIGPAIVDDTGDPAGSPTKKVAKTRTTILKDRANFQGTGTNDTEFQDPDFQAWQGYWAGRSNVKSYFYFGSGAIPSGLTAADIIKVEVYLYSTYWYNGAGSAAIRLHGATDKTTVNGNTVKPSWTAGGGVIATVSMGKNQGKWVALPRSTYQYFANGTVKGFGLEAPTTEVQNKNLRYSGKIEGHAGFEYSWKRAKMKITYLQAA